MELLIKRIIEILQAEMPTVINNTNINFVASDTAEFGVPLTLPVPENANYLIGTQHNIQALPSVMVYGSDNVKVDAYDDSVPVNMTYPFNIDLMLCTESTIETERMVERYSHIIFHIMLNHRGRFLDNATHDDPYGEWGAVPLMGQGFVKRGNQRLLTARVTTLYKVNKLVIDKMFKFT